MFDAESFLNQTVEDANDTQRLQVPAGEYIAQIESVKAREWKKRDDPTVHGVSLDVNWNVDDANIRQLFGRDKVLCPQGVFLDLTESGNLDFGKGKNSDLGRLREATGLNTPGQPFAFTMLTGKVAKIKVKEVVQDDGTIRSRVVAVAKI
jgi:hypothetical protein